MTMFMNTWKGIWTSLVCLTFQESHDVVMLRVFPITLTRAAKRWVDRLSLGTINTWDLLKKAFIQRNCLPSKTTKQLEEIHNFKQKEGQHLLQGFGHHDCQLLDSQGPIPNKTPTQALDAIQTMVDHHLHKWHDGSTNKRLSSDSLDGIAAIINKLDSLGRDMKKLKENVHVIQVGCKNCGGAHLNKDCPLHEEVKSVEKVKYGEFGRPFPINNENSARYSVGPPGYYIRVDNHPPFVGQCKVIFANNKAPTDETSSKGTNELHGVSFIYYGASINILPGSMFDHLKLTNLKETNMLVEMAEMTKKALVGLVENVLVKIYKILFPFDFMIIDMLGVGEDMIIFHMNGNVHHSVVLVEKVCVINKVQGEELFNPLKEQYEGEKGMTKMVEPETTTLRLHYCKRLQGKEMSFLDLLLIKYGNSKIDDTISARRFTNLNHQVDLILSMKSYFPDFSQEDQIKHRLRDYSFKEWLKLKIGHTNVNKSMKNAVLNERVLDCFEEDSETSKDPYSRSFENYKLVFDIKIEQLADEYELGIGKKGYVLDDIWENSNKSMGKHHTHDMMKDSNKKRYGRVV
nr:hypothetical protein [Tanacetum cinerariifolium]